MVSVKDATSGKYHLAVTKIPTARLSAAGVAQVKAVRWQIELPLKELKSYYRIEDMPSRNLAIVKTLVHAAVLTLEVIRRLLAAVRAKLRSKRERLPEQRSARVFAALSLGLLTLALGMVAEARRMERRLFATILHEAVAPNAWRRRLFEAVVTRTHQSARKQPE